jgi:hypothetical protein
MFSVADTYSHPCACAIKEQSHRQLLPTGKNRNPGGSLTAGATPA